MSKKQEATKTPLSEGTKRIIIISIICAVAVVILAIALALILKPSSETTDTVKDSETNGTSSDSYIKNRTFEYYTIYKGDDSYPREAQNWTLYTKDTDSTNKNLTAVTDNENAIYGIVDTADWDKVVADLGAGYENLANPGVRPDVADEEDYVSDTSIFMLATKNATNISLMNGTSYYVTVSSNKYVKVSVWLNTSALKDGSTANITIQDNATSSVTEYVSKKTIAKADGWNKFEFNIFNKYSYSKNFKINIGIGDVYEGTNGEGVLFVDNISVAELSSNDFRKNVASENSYTFPAKENDSEPTYYALDNSVETLTVDQYNSSDYAKVDGEVYSPFISGQTGDLAQYNEKFTNIYTISANSSASSESEKYPTALKLNFNGTGATTDGNFVIKYSDTDADCVHLSFWARLSSDNVVTTANFVVESKQVGTTDWVKLDDACISNIDAVKDITASDGNCGWYQYHVYLKPSSLKSRSGDEIRLSFAIGSDTSKANNVKLDGRLFVSDVAYEVVSPDTYSSASSGTYTSKASITSYTGSTNVTNGSFTSMDNTTPANWTHVFAGDTAIYKDGKSNDLDINKKAEAISGTGVEKEYADGAKVDGYSYDDTAKNVLKISNAQATSQGYLSNSFTLSSKSVYVISVLAKVDGAGKLGIYLIDNSKESREDMIVAKIEETGTNNETADKAFNLNKLDDNGWVRYYIVVVTGSESMSVRLALFNGTISGSYATTGTVYFDRANSTSIGTYTLAANEDDETALKTVTYTATAGYDTISLDETTNALVIENIASDALTTIQPSADDWASIRKPDEKADDTTDDDATDDSTDSTSNSVDLGLLFSVISSILLVAALLVVVVIKIFRKKKAQ